jgi:hypothetical protein
VLYGGGVCLCSGNGLLLRVLDGSFLNLLGDILDLIVGLLFVGGGIVSVGRGLAGRGLLTALFLGFLRLDLLDLFLGLVNVLEN